MLPHPAERMRKMFRKISEGNVVANPSSGKTYVAPRIAVLPDGKIAVSFTAETRINSEDFITMISYSEDGDNWSEAKVVWPHLLDKKSNYASIRNSLDGRFCMGGVMWPDFDGNKDYWSDEIGGMLENKLIFSMSEDGYAFPGPIEIDLPYYGSAENPGGAFVDEDGTMQSNICIGFRPCCRGDHWSSVDFVKQNPSP